MLQRPTLPQEDKPQRTRRGRGRPRKSEVAADDTSRIIGICREIPKTSQKAHR